MRPGVGAPLNYVLDDDGVPLPIAEEGLLEWAAWAFDPDPKVQMRRRRLAYTYIRKFVWVSTVFLAVDHGFSFLPGSKPVLWETMIFGGLHDGYQNRYVSREDARLGHAAAVLLARSQPRKVRASKGRRRYIRRTKAADV